MKHLNLISLLLLLLLPAGAKAQFAWYGSDGVAQVETGLGNGTSIDVGKWFFFNDAVDGGKSKIVWDVETNVIDDNLVQQCGGISGTAVLDKAELPYAPRIGVGFYVGGVVEPDSYKPVLADATAWGGIAISYSCDVAAIIELGLGETVDASLGYANPLYNLPSAPTGNFVRIPWSAFKQPGWGMKQIEISDAVAALATVRFVIQNSTGSYHFSINAIGSYEMPETPQSSTTCKLAITATGNGSVTYSGTTLRNQTNSFTVDKGTNPKLTFSPDEGYIVKSVTVGGVDVTSDVSDNSYTINDIQGSTTVAVVFDEKSALKCATPTITFAGGKLKLSCETEDVVFSYKMTVEGAKSGYVINEVPVGALQSKYKVSVYAMKEGYENSDTATLEFSLDACDTNKDGTVDVADIATVIDKMAGN